MQLRMNRSYDVSTLPPWRTRLLRSGNVAIPCSRRSTRSPHRDAFSRNLALMPREAGVIDLVALDWEHAGVGVIGEEIAQLMAASLLLLDVPAASIDVFHAAILEAYTRGLRDTGWEGNPSVVRLGFAAAVALRTG